MNKLVLSTLSVAAMGMVFFSGGTAYAADKEGNTVVEYSVEGDYTLVVPEKVNLSNDNATEMSVKTINRNLEPGKEVEVTLSSGLSADGEIELQRVGATSDVITSSFKSNNSTVTMANPVIGSFSGYAIEETEVSKIQIGSPQGDKKAGAYQTTLTFTAAFK
ncbi:TPA_asm: hypothetical protein GJA55_10905 [Listeria monocytogenes]|uniref:Fimbrial protein n=1 Tax=Listeria monocytogenes TaxID=1639 RepID=A0A5M1L9V7_LISMN|nr:MULTISPECIES: hypothetical protein [Listeria]EAF4522420.1 hypothetical protein [Listeria monocytogenes serotype 4b]EAF4535235.1 hypothetical protein [Listeria monocytogenes serotype 1/2a]EAG6290687.1 hypothetical protein [Listeria monocytogenes CFSAN003825]EAG6317941.1 hypothetical protein [Listeria monocytogenes CFSAN003824]EAG6342331.1 hypothetical protein [Listeria monocytogenes CFSAN003811]